MNKLLFIPIAAMLFLAPVLAGASMTEHPGCSGNCLECHKFEKSEAETIVKKLKEANPRFPTAARVKDVKLAPAGGLWQIDLDIDGKQGALFVDISKKYLLSISEIVPIDSIKKQEPRKVDFSKLPLKEAFVLGTKGAAKKVAVFTDPDCPACKVLHEEMKKVLTQRKDITFYLFFNPLPQHPDAPRKAQAILCEKSVKVLDDAYAGKAVPESTCKGAGELLEKSKALAMKMQFNSTPTLVRNDGLVQPGALPADRLIEWIDGK